MKVKDFRIGEVEKEKKKSSPRYPPILLKLKLTLFTTRKYSLREYLLVPPVRQKSKRLKREKTSDGITELQNHVITDGWTDRHVV